MIPQQTELVFRSHGGRRAGAGRPRGTRVSHGRRPRFAKARAAHVTLRARYDVRNLRNARHFKCILRCLERARGRLGLRVIHFTVLGNHLHLIVEGDSWESLGAGMKGLEVRIVRALNRLMGRRGSLFDDHYRADFLQTPTRLVNAIAYVLGNAAHHYGREGFDPYSSAGLRGRWREVLAEPTTWLVRVGWMRSKYAHRLDAFGLGASG